MEMTPLSHLNAVFSNEKLWAVFEKKTIQPNVMKPNWHCLNQLPGKVKIFIFYIKFVEEFYNYFSLKIFTAQLNVQILSKRKQRWRTKHWFLMKFSLKCFPPAGGSRDVEGEPEKDGLRLQQIEIRIYFSIESSRLMIFRPVSSPSISFIFQLTNKDIFIFQFKFNEIMFIKIFCWIFLSHPFPSPFVRWVIQS